MKTSPLTTPHPTSRLSEHAFLKPLWSTGPGVSAAAFWLSCNGIDPGSVLAAITQRLKDRGRLLPKDKLVAYHRRVLFDEFITHWVEKNKRSSIRDWFENGEVKDEAKVKAEFEPFEAVVLDLCTAAAFEREVRKLVNVAEARRTGTSFGDGLSFEGFCHLSSWTLANRLLVNFEPDRRARNGSSVRYLLRTATGCFLNRCNGQKDYASAGDDRLPRRLQGQVAECSGLQARVLPPSADLRREGLAPPRARAGTNRPPMEDQRDRPAAGLRLGRCTVAQVLPHEKVAGERPDPATGQQSGVCVLSDHNPVPAAGDRPFLKLTALGGKFHLEGSEAGVLHALAIGGFTIVCLLLAWQTPPPAADASAATREPHIVVPRPADAPAAPPAHPSTSD